MTLEFVRLGEQFLLPLVQRFERLKIAIEFLSLVADQRALGAANIVGHEVEQVRAAVEHLAANPVRDAAEERLEGQVGRADRRHGLSRSGRRVAVVHGFGAAAVADRDVLEDPGQSVGNRRVDGLRQGAFARRAGSQSPDVRRVVAECDPPREPLHQRQP